MQIDAARGRAPRTGVRLDTEKRARPRGPRLGAGTLACALALLAACAGSGPDSCSIQVVGVEKFDVRPGAADLAYRVKGQAGSAGVASLVAKLGPQNFITGKGVPVGPGPFVAIVELNLTGAPPELLALLEVGSKRCRANAKLPR
jgi:hypothetical protein